MFFLINCITKQAGTTSLKAFSKQCLCLCHCLCLCLCICISVWIWIADVMSFQKMYGLRGPWGRTAVLQLTYELRPKWENKRRRAKMPTNTSCIFRSKMPGKNRQTKARRNQLKKSILFFFINKYIWRFYVLDWTNIMIKSCRDVLTGALFLYSGAS